MKFKKRSLWLILAALVLWALPSAALAQVSVYAEGAYTETDLAVNIYADIDAGNPLCSYGITLFYNSSKLTIATATKNEALWYFGTTSDKKPYMNPNISTAGEIIFIGGKLDTGSPTAGVYGSRVLLGKATFNRVAGQDTTFGITLDLGRFHPPFDNFVTSVAPAEVLDGSVTFGSATIWERGDANGSGSITVRDIATVKGLMGASDFPIWADCNDSGSITVRDIACIKEILQQ